MSTENETWRDASSAEENSGAGRDGNQFNKEGGYSRPSYNRDNGDRPYRPRFNSENGDRPQRPYNSDRPYRPRFNPGADNGDRPQRPRYNNDNGDRPYRPRYNSEGGDRPQRPYGNNSGDRPYRPRYNSEGGDRHQPGKRRLSFRAVCRTYHPILCQLPTSRPGSDHPRHCRTQRAQRVPGVSHSSLRRLPASDARNGEALQASHEGVAIWQKGNLRAEECGRITATLVRCFGHEVTEPIKY